MWLLLTKHVQLLPASRTQAGPRGELASTDNLVARQFVNRTRVNFPYSTATLPIPSAAVYVHVPLPSHLRRKSQRKVEDTVVAGYTTGGSYQRSMSRQRNQLAGVERRS